MDDTVSPAGGIAEPDRRETLRERELLYALLCLVRRCPGGLTTSGLDAVLAAGTRCSRRGSPRP